MSYRQQFMDRRRVERRTSGVEAFVKIPLRTPISCLVTNISPLGALIALDRYEYLPYRFRIDIDGFETDCTVSHRDRNFYGLAFAKSFDAAYDYAIPVYAAA